MTVFYNSLQESYLGYAAIFVCIGFGLIFLRKVDKGEVGPGYWSMSFFLNSLGFVFWSGIFPLAPWEFFLIGEVFHILGFFALACGAYRFTGNAYRRWNAYVVVIWAAVWITGILLIDRNAFIADLLLKGVRALLFILAGIMILGKMRVTALVGGRLAGWSLIFWGVYLMIFSFLHLQYTLSLAFGLLVGFQILSALGMVAMAIDRIRIRADESEIHVKRLEGLLPICSHCKKIRDENNQWHALEIFIKERSAAEFSHGICPECLKKYYPDI